jgi:hypothetical protein
MKDKQAKLFQKLTPAWNPGKFCRIFYCLEGSIDLNMNNFVNMGISQKFSTNFFSRETGDFIRHSNLDATKTNQ